MYATLALIVLATSAVSAGVLPRTEATITPVEDGTFSARAITHAFVCQNAPWVDPCQNLEFNTGACHNFGNGYDNTISSIGPDAGTSCTIYDAINCAGASFTVNYPGIADLSSVGWNDRASSIKCN